MRLLCIALLCLIPAPFASAQELPFPAAVEDPATLSKAMPDLARAAIAAYRDDDRRKYLDTLFRLQMVAGHYEAFRNAIGRLDDRTSSLALRSLGVYRWVR